jgi:hypothetical protein
MQMCVFERFLTPPRRPHSDGAAAFRKRIIQLVGWKDDFVSEWWSVSVLFGARLARIGNTVTEFERDCCSRGNYEESVEFAGNSFA